MPDSFCDYTESTGIEIARISLTKHFVIRKCIYQIKTFSCKRLNFNTNLIWNISQVQNKITGHNQSVSHLSLGALKDWSLTALKCFFLGGKNEPPQFSSEQEEICQKCKFFSQTEFLCLRQPSHGGNNSQNQKHRNIGHQ